MSSILDKLTGKAPPRASTMLQPRAKNTPQPPHLLGSQTKPDRVERSPEETGPREVPHLDALVKGLSYLGSYGGRALRGELHEQQAAEDLSSLHSRLTPAPPGTKPPRPLMEDGKLRVVDWNLHHGFGPDEDGAPDTLKQQIGAMREARGDVYTLQEVSPWQAEELARGTGMDAYYTANTPTQGNAILVHPDLEVKDNDKKVLSHDIAPGNLEQAYQAMNSPREPRSAQFLRVRPPGSEQDVVLWNAHLSHSAESNEERLRQTDRMLSGLDGFRAPKDVVIGGGDLNSLEGSPVLQRLRETKKSYGTGLDWLTVQGAPGLHLTTYQQAGLSDHPMLIGEVALTVP